MDRMTDGPGRSKNELLKESSQGLLGPLGDELADPTVPFSEDALQLLKHHGSYQQDNRDSRAARRKAGLKEYTMMVRTKTPGGYMTTEQYLLCDDLATKYGQDDLRITSRQGFQFHGVVKGNLRALIHDLNKLQEITTQGACGDVVRNTVCSPVVDVAEDYANCGADLLALSMRMSREFLPKSSSYFDLWLNDERARVEPDGSVTFTEKGPSKPVEEPLYGKTYLPRKFKIGIALDTDNSIDVHANDVGILAVTDGDGRVVGYEVLAGGGLGHSHSKTETYARIATPVTHVKTIEEVMTVTEAIIKVQRDHGNREHRHLARLKYTMDRLGTGEFARLVGEQAGWKLAPPSGAKVKAQPDHLGWHRQKDGRWYVGVWVENGRIRDFGNGVNFKSGLRELVETFRPSVRLTAHHNIIFADIAENQVAAVKVLLAKHRLPTDEGISPLRRHEMACPALPLCGLSLAEAERALPGLMEEIEKLGHADAEVTIRMTGCPNSCARPETAEIGIIGRGPNKYNLYAGGDPLGTRMNTLVAESVTVQEVPGRIAKWLDAWKAGRNNGETFGDWSHRIGPEELRALNAG
jgi:sulfite reductase (ferredoxin)